MRHLTALFVAMGLLLPIAARAADAPPADGAGRRPGQIFQRLNDTLAQLDLSPDQQKKIKDLMDATRQKLLDLRDEAGGDQTQLRAKFRDIFADTRQQLGEILTDAQQQKLRDLMQANLAGAETGPAAAKPADADRPKPPADASRDLSVKSSESSSKGDAHSSASNPPDRPASAKPSDKSDTPPDVGIPAPPISLHSADGHPFSLAAMKGRVVVVIFGSYSTPTFRDHAAAINQLARDLGTHAVVWVVYTREAHATGEWEVDRNRDENVNVAQPKTEADRVAAAQQATRALKLTVPVLVDGMDDAVTHAYALAPEGAVVINRDGTIAAVQHWFDPSAIRVHVDAATTRPAH